MSLEGKTALITGASKGIGLGIAHAMVKEGMNVTITGRTQSDLKNAASQLSAGKQILSVPSDVRQLDQMEELVSQTLEKFGSIDVVIANAGIGHFASIEDLSPEQWQETIDINLTGAFNTLKAGLSAIKESKGYFITISSLAGTNFFAGGSAYNASKFGLTGFTQAVMLDLRKYGIKTTTIMPGSVSTYFNNHTPSDSDNWKIQIEDLGQMVIDLLKIHPRTLPSKVEVRPTSPPSK